MVRKKKKVRLNKHVLHLTCENCGHKFLSERFKKYCTYKCQREVNNMLAKNKYAEMRDVFLKAKGRID